MIALDTQTRQANRATQNVFEELKSLRSEIVGFVEAHKGSLASVHPSYRISASNLLHYLAMRRHDLRPLQMKLALLGLSSLGRAESAVLATVDAVIAILNRLADDPPSSSQAEPID